VIKLGISSKNPPILTGNAVAADVANGKTFYSTSSLTKLTGTAAGGGGVTYTASGATTYTQYNDIYTFFGTSSGNPYFKGQTNNNYLWFDTGSQYWTLSSILGDYGTNYFIADAGLSLTGTYESDDTTDTLTIAQTV